MNFTSEFKSTYPLKEVHSEENPLRRLTYRLFRTNIDESKHEVCNAYINIHHPLKLLTSSDVYRQFFVRSSFQEVSGGTKSIFVQINGLMGHKIRGDTDDLGLLLEGEKKTSAVPAHLASPSLISQSVMD